MLRWILPLLIFAGVARADNTNIVSPVQTFASAVSVDAAATVTYKTDIDRSDVLGLSWDISSSVPITATFALTYANDPGDTFTAGTSQSGVTYTGSIAVSGTSPQRALTDLKVPPCRLISVALTNNATQAATATVRLFRQ